MLDLGDSLRLPVPPDRQERYGDCVGRDILLGIRPEHITEKRTHTSPTDADFRAGIEVLEPLGVDTMVFININGQEVCARSSPRAVARWGRRWSSPFN